MSRAKAKSKQKAERGLKAKLVAELKANEAAAELKRLARSARAALSPAEADKCT